MDYHLYHRDLMSRERGDLFPPLQKGAKYAPPLSDETLAYEERIDMVTSEDAIRHALKSLPFDEWVTGKNDLTYAHVWMYVREAFLRASGKRRIGKSDVNLQDFRTESGGIDRRKLEHWFDEEASDAIEQALEALSDQLHDITDIVLNRLHELYRSEGGLNGGVFHPPELLFGILPVFFGVPRRARRDQSRIASFTCSEIGESFLFSKEIRKIGSKVVRCEITLPRHTFLSSEKALIGVHRAFGPFGLKVLLGILLGLEAHGSRSPGYEFGYYEESMSAFLKRLNLGRRANVTHVLDTLSVFREARISIFQSAGPSTQWQILANFSCESDVVRIGSTGWHQDRSRLLVLPCELVRASWTDSSRAIPLLLTLVALWKKRPFGVVVRAEHLIRWLEHVESEASDHANEKYRNLWHALRQLERDRYIRACRVLKAYKGKRYYLETVQDSILNSRTRFFIEPPYWLEGRRYQPDTFEPCKEIAEPQISKDVLRQLSRESGLSTKDFGEALGIPKDKLQIYLRGTGPIPVADSRQLLKRLESSRLEGRIKTRRWPNPKRRQ